MSDSLARLRDLPSVDHLLAHARVEALLRRFNRQYVIRHCRAVLEEYRREIRQGHASPAQGLDEESIAARLAERIDAEREGTLVRVVNATGTVLHTNLGRALLPTPAVDAICQAARHPVTLEYDLAEGRRSRRERNIERLLVDLTGAEAGTVVNNNAAAVLVALNTLANGRDVIVSRGELIEIGGAFRIPDIMGKSGAILKEVGTTNRTHREDYERAITDRTGLILKVHTSNYRIVGFHAEVGLPELVAIGRARAIPVMEDLGSGAVVDLSAYGLPKEPLVAERVAAGADIVTFSGDKVLGGPQAGLIVGGSRWVREIDRNPLHRAVRCGKLTLAGLEATLALYQRSPCIAEDIPTLRAFLRPTSELLDMGTQLLPALQRAVGREFHVSLEESTSQVGSGALPTEEIPTTVIAIAHDAIGADRIAQRFRAARPPIIGRISGERFLLDLRTVFNPDDLIPNWGSGT